MLSSLSCSYTSLNEGWIYVKTPKEADPKTIKPWPKDNSQYQCSACVHPPEAHRTANVKNTIGKQVHWCSYRHCRCKGYSD